MFNKKLGKQNAGKAGSANDVNLGDPFVYKHLGSMASVGRYKALVDLSQTKVILVIIIIIIISFFEYKLLNKAFTILFTTGCKGGCDGRVFELADLAVCLFDACFELEEQAICHDQLGDNLGLWER